MKINSAVDFDLSSGQALGSASVKSCNWWSRLLKQRPNMMLG
ncbi:hypothetical protein [Aestuariivirga sp.]|jgi:hypothetical protein